jgi:membrane protein YdbS with pleckstrin-like domain
MPLVTAGNPAPVTITKYLLPNEKRVITVRKHVAILLRPVAFLILGVVLAGVLTGFIGVHNGWALLIIWLLWLLVLGYFSYQAVQWWVSYFVLTNQRCLQTSGLITRRVNMLPLVKVTDVILERNLRGRVLGYGKLTLESAGTFQALGNIDYLPYPEQLYLEISMLIFPYKADDQADD